MPVAGPGRCWVLVALLLALPLSPAQPHGAAAARRKLASSNSAATKAYAGTEPNCFMVTVHESTFQGGPHLRATPQRRLLSASMADHVDTIVGKAKASLGEAAVAKYQSLGPVFPGFSIHARHEVDAARLMAFLDEAQEVATYSRCVRYKAIAPVPARSIRERADLGPPPLTAAVNGVYQSDDGAAVRSLPGYGNLYGQGIKVAVLDSGVDFRHPGLGGCFGPKCKVVGGYDFIDPSRTNASTLRGCALWDHGTNVAGILAANYTRPHTFANGSSTPVTFLGVAPGVSLLVYRIFECMYEPTVSDPLVAAAMQKAYEDGADIINLSLGEDGAWENGFVILAERLANLGVVVVMAQGNSANKGLFLGSSAPPPVNGGRTPTFPLEVGSTDDPRLTGFAAINISSGNTSMQLGAYAYLANQDVPPLEQLRGLPLRLTASWHQGRNRWQDACNGTQLGNLTGAIAVVKRGTCYFVEKIANAAAAGARGVIIWNNLPDPFYAAIAPAGNVTIPTLAIAGVSGDALAAWLHNISQAQAQTPTITSYVSNSLPPAISFYTTWGPTADLRLSPDFAAPGGNVYTLSFWANRTQPAPTTVLSGTSFSTPYVAGCIALYLQAARAMGLDPTPWQVRDAFAPTATPVHTLNYTTGKVLSHLESPLQAGTGSVNLTAAIATLSAPVTLSPPTLLLPTGITTITTTFNITNASPSATRRYTLRHVPTDSISTTSAMKLAINSYMNPIEYYGATYVPNATTIKLGLAFIADRGVELGSNGTTATVTVGPNSSVAVQVEFRVPPILLNGSYLVAGYITATPTSPAQAANGTNSTSGGTAGPAHANNTSGSNTSGTQGRGSTGSPPALILPYLGYTSPFSSLSVLLPGSPGGLGVPAGASLLNRSDGTVQVTDADILMLLVDDQGQLLPPYRWLNAGTAGNDGGGPLPGVNVTVFSGADYGASTSPIDVNNPAPAPDYNTSDITNNPPVDYNTSGAPGSGTGDYNSSGPSLDYGAGNGTSSTPSPLWKVLPQFVNDGIQANMPVVYLNLQHQYAYLNMSLIQVNATTGEVVPGGMAYLLYNVGPDGVYCSGDPVPYSVPTMYAHLELGYLLPIPDGTYAAYFTFERAVAVSDAAQGGGGGGGDGGGPPVVVEEWLSPPFTLMTPTLPPEDFTV